MRARRVEQAEDPAERVARSRPRSASSGSARGPVRGPRRRAPGRPSAACAGRVADREGVGAEHAEAVASRRPADEDRLAGPAGQRRARRSPTTRRSTVRAGRRPEGQRVADPQAEPVGQAAGTIAEPPASSAVRAAAGRRPRSQPAVGERDPRPTTAAASSRTPRKAASKRRDRADPGDAGHGGELAAATPSSSADRPDRGRDHVAGHDVGQPGRAARAGVLRPRRRGHDHRQADRQGADGEGGPARGRGRSEPRGEALLGAQDEPEREPGQPAERPEDERREQGGDEQHAVDERAQPDRRRRRPSADARPQEQAGDADDDEHDDEPAQPRPADRRPVGRAAAAPRPARSGRPDGRLERRGEGHERCRPTRADGPIAAGGTDRAVDRDRSRCAPDVAGDQARRGRTRGRARRPSRRRPGSSAWTSTSRLDLPAGRAGRPEQRRPRGPAPTTVIDSVLKMRNAPPNRATAAISAVVAWKSAVEARSEAARSAGPDSTYGSVVSRVRARPATTASAVAPAASPMSTRVTPSVAEQGLRRAERDDHDPAAGRSDRARRRPGSRRSERVDPGRPRPGSVIEAPTGRARPARRQPLGVIRRGRSAELGAERVAGRAGASRWIAAARRRVDARGRSPAPAGRGGRVGVPGGAGYVRRSISRRRHGDARRAGDRLRRSPRTGRPR